MSSLNEMRHELSARIVRISGLLIFLVSPLSNAYGQSKRPAEVLALVDQANSLPAEFRADTLLRIALSKLITDAKWKKELIEEAYWSAAHATLPYAQMAQIPSDLVAVNSFRANRLDGLSLQSRAIEAMLAIDSKKARLCSDKPSNRFARKEFTT